MIFLSQFLDPKIFDELTDQLRLIRSFAKHHQIKKPFWLGETSFAYGGGAHGLSNTFVDCYNWVDKVCMVTKYILLMIGIIARASC